VTRYLKSRRRQAISEAYRRGYALKGDDHEGWAAEGVWPDP